MIRRSRMPKQGDERQRIRFAWHPVVLCYGGERIVVWLERYVVYERYEGSGKWERYRRRTLADAALEKLNPLQPKPAPSPPSNMSNYTPIAGYNIGQLIDGLGAHGLRGQLGMQGQVSLQGQALAQMLGQSQPPVGSP